MVVIEFGSRFVVLWFSPPPSLLQHVRSDDADPVENRAYGLLAATANSRCTGRPFSTVVIISNMQTGLRRDAHNIVIPISPPMGVWRWLMAGGDGDEVGNTVTSVLVMTATSSCLCIQKS